MTSEQISLNGVPIDDLGVGLVAPAAAPAASPWAIALATSVLSGATGWALEGIAQKVRGRRR